MSAQPWAEVVPDLKQLDIDFAYFSHFFNELSNEGREALVRRVIRESAAESGALEELFPLKPGQSRTIAIEAENWEEILEDATERESFEDVVRALQYATNWIKDDRPITLGLIRELHEIACKSQAAYEAVASISGSPKVFSKKLEHGCFKTEQNFVQQRSGKPHIYCPPESVDAEMGQFVAEIQSEDFERLHPVAQAAYAHYCLAQIHPFQDGNGRVARVIASVYLIRAYEVPLVVYADRKSTYLQALEAVESQNYGELTQNMADRLAATLAELSQVLAYDSGPSPSQQLADLLSLVEDHAAVAFANIDQIATRLFSELEVALTEELESLAAASGGTLNIIYPGYVQPISVDTPDGYRMVNHFKIGDNELPYDYLGYRFAEERLMVGIELIKDGVTTGIKGMVYIAIGRAFSDTAHFPFALIAARDSSATQPDRIGSVRIRLEDCFPNTGTNTQERIKTLAKLTCNEMLKQISHETENRLRQTGSFLGDLAARPDK